ncbi:hypothetical protein KHS38_09945 [Mucilaginibacter sp. Bleaf8]|nr:hypothetical protein [Mucilaginibacter sp. Bleaf8]
MGRALAQSKPDKLPAWAMGPFIRPAEVNSVISPDSATVFPDPMHKQAVQWEANDTFNPAAAVYNHKIYLLYRAEDRSGKGISQRTSRLGLAESRDGLHMKKRPQPVLFPADDAQKEFEWTGGCEDPRVAVTESGTYVVLYTQWNHKLPRLAAATSTDLVHWHKHGPVFQKAYGGRFFDRASKSASIITRLASGRQVITKLNGKYWMYWGEENVYAATSTDLVNWTPVVDQDGNLKKIISPRDGYFDSIFTECGPPAILTDAGIVLIYNGKNSSQNGDSRYAANAYCAGQVLFDKNDPLKVVGRLDRPFLVPEASFEKSGQYPAGTVFAEGMAYFNRKWYLYYGCADSRVAVAVYEPGADTR